MGFVAKSAFWLGLVYSAMPFDTGKPNAFQPKTAATLGTYASALRQNADAWRSAIEVAASLCARDCPGAAPAKKEREAASRRLSPEKSE